MLGAASTVQAVGTQAKVNVELSGRFKPLHSQWNVQQIITAFLYNFVQNRMHNMLNVHVFEQ